MNYLFLDIDGVLNTGRYSDYLVKNGLCETDEDGYLFDPEAVDWLQYIIEKTEAKIVITSTWRLDGDMQVLWRNRELAGEVVGVTPSLPREKAVGKMKLFYGHRGMEVEAWLQDYASEPNRAYLQIPSNLVPSANNARITTVFDDEVTPVEDILTTSDNSKDDYYNLNGQKVQTVKKGIYIKNGKKVIIR